METDANHGYRKDSPLLTTRLLLHLHFAVAFERERKSEYFNRIRPELFVW